MKRHTLLRYAALFAFLVLLLSPVAIANAESDDDDDSPDDEEDTETTTSDDYEDEYEVEHEPEYHRDSNGTLWIQTEILTVRLDSDLPAYQFWYTRDNNGSLARFSVSYLMIVEFEDMNGDGVYQVNETLDFAPLEAFEWVLQTGSVTNDLEQTTEVYASYSKGGLSYDWEDDWFEDWMPGYEHEDEEDHAFTLSDEEDDNETDYTDFSRFEGMTLQFYAHLYMNDYNGTVSDDEGIKANYTVLGGVELKVDIEIGNFPFLSNTSKVAVLNYLQEDVASTEDSNHNIRFHEDHGDDDHESEEDMAEDDWGEKFEDRDEDDDEHEDDVQELSLVDASTNVTQGFYRWLNKAVITLPGGSQDAVDVDASYWTDGHGLLLFMAYPNFDGGSILHDPSMGVVETAAPSVPLNPLEEPATYIAIIALALIAIVGLGLAVKRR